MVEMRPEPPKSAEQGQIEAIEAQRGLAAKKFTETAYTGDQMATWMSTAWPFFQEQVIGPMEKEAYATFRDPGFDPTNQGAVVQVQAILRVIDLIKAKTDGLIARGKDARAKLIEMQNSTNPKEASS